MVPELEVLNIIILRSCEKLIEHNGEEIDEEK